MRNQRLKILVLVLLLAGTIGVSLTVSPEQVDAALQCEDVFGCTGAASCGGAGTVSKCNISCENGAAIHCGGKPIQ